MNYLKPWNLVFFKMINALLLSMLICSCMEPQELKKSTSIDDPIIEQEERAQNLVIKLEHIKEKNWFVNISELTKDSLVFFRDGTSTNLFKLRNGGRIQLSEDYVLTTSEWSWYENNFSLKLAGYERELTNSSQLYFSLKNSYEITNLTTTKMSLRKTCSEYEQLYHKLFLK